MRIIIKGLKNRFPTGNMGGGGGSRVITHLVTCDFRQGVATGNGLLGRVFSRNLNATVKLTLWSNVMCIVPCLLCTVYTVHSQYNKDG